MFHQYALRRMSRGEKDETFHNPILPGFNPDPSIIRVNRDYFLTTSTFEYFPGAPIYHSTDLIQWTLIGHALTRKSQLDIKAPEPGGGVWACTLRFHQDTFYLTTCVWDRYRPQEYKQFERAWPRGFYVKTKDIWKGDWSEPVYFDEPGFDQDLFFDDGKVYLSTTHRVASYDPDSGMKQLGIHVCEIDLDTGDSLTQAKLVRESKVGVGVSEGSHFLKRGEWYYLFTAEGGTESGHSEYCLRSKNMAGPWEECPHNPLIQNTTEMEVQNTGHCDFVEDADGNWWAVCLAVRPQKSEHGFVNSVFGESQFMEKLVLTLVGRESFLMPVTWKDDWPVLNLGNPLALLGAGAGLYVYNHPVKWRDNFDTPNLQLGWYWKNTPVKETEASLTARKGFLRIRGGPSRLHSPSSPTAIFRKQTHRNGVWKTRLTFNPKNIHCEAGTVVYWNYCCFTSIGIRLENEGKRQIVVNFSAQKQTTTDLETPDAAVDLVIECSDSRYRLGYLELSKTAKAEIAFIGEITAAEMTVDPPIGLPFTGMMLGLYSFGDLASCRESADFEFAEFM